MLNVDIKNLDAILRNFAGAPRILQEHLDDATDEALANIRDQLQKYPPSPPGSTYVRTGNLGRGWGATSRVAVGPGGVSKRISNRVPYAPYVQGRGTQAASNRHWETAEDIADRMLPATKRILGQAVMRAAKDIEG